MIYSKAAMILGCVAVTDILVSISTHFALLMYMGGVFHFLKISAMQLYTCASVDRKGKIDCLVGTHEGGRLLVIEMKMETKK